MEKDLEIGRPSETRVQRRAWAIGAVVSRSFVETLDDPIEAERLYARLIHWISTMELYSELEPSERGMMEADIGSLDPQTVANGLWRSEGLAVLAWSLNAIEMPQHDQMVDPAEVANSLFLLEDDAKHRAQALTLRSADKLDRFSDMQLAVHWRIRDFAIRRQAMNFRVFAETAWFGPLKVDGISFSDDDLAIDNVPISRAPADRFYQCQSIARERHQAINWLRGVAQTYSEVDTST
ncbi:MAG: DUF4272 domain-containing protein [Cyanobacteria bacterium P01_F01_bin.150]